MPVAADRATLRLGAASLPDGEVRMARSGRAEVSVRRDGDSLTVTANCDSLMREMELLEEELWRATEESERWAEREESLRMELEQRSSGWRMALGWLLAGFAAGVVLTTIIYKRYG